MSEIFWPTEKLLASEKKRGFRSIVFVSQLVKECSQNIYFRTVQGVRARGIQKYMLMF